jgi:soluble lytic murein transglycosylase
LTRLPLLLVLSCLGTGLALLGGRDLLARRPALTPATTPAHLERLQRWDPDPWRRREASLLLEARSGEPVEQRQWLRGQGWGPDPLAALVLKKDALAASALGRPEKALALWSQLDRRFPDDPARADALYVLGEEVPGQRRLLLKRFPAHPAALAAALAAGPGAGARR